MHTLHSLSINRMYTQLIQSNRKTGNNEETMRVRKTRNRTNLTKQFGGS